MAARFPTTQWGLVLAAVEGEDAQARQALEDLCAAYWYPLYVYARKCGYDPDRASDVTQAFFAALLERGALRGTDPEKGRLRSFLLASFRNFFSHERQREQAAKRGGPSSRFPDRGISFMSLDMEEAERRFEREPASDLTPEQVFECRWGLVVMEQAMHRLEKQMEDGGKAQLFEALKPYLTGGGNASYRMVAAEMSMTVGAIKVAVHRLRQSYGRTLRQVISETIVDASEVDDELRYLLTRIQPWQA